MNEQEQEKARLIQENLELKERVRKVEGYRDLAEAMAKDLKDELESCEDLETQLEQYAGKRAFPYQSLPDQMKCDVLLDNWNKFKLEDLDKFIESL